jgi:hypothetical protein
MKWGIPFLAKMKHHLGWTFVKVFWDFWDAGRNLERVLEVAKRVGIEKTLAFDLSDDAKLKVAVEKHRVVLHIAGIPSYNQRASLDKRRSRHALPS